MERYIRKEPARLPRMEIYKKKVLALMYPEKGRGVNFNRACAQVLDGYGISDKADRKRLFREIGAAIKKRADEKKLIQEAEQSIMDAEMQSILDNLKADQLKKDAARKAKQKEEDDEFPLLRHAGLMDDEEKPEQRV